MMLLENTMCADTNWCSVNARGRDVWLRFVSAQSESWLRDRDQCDGGLWWCWARSDHKAASANNDFPISEVTSNACLARCTLMRWSTSTM